MKVNIPGNSKAFYFLGLGCGKAGHRYATDTCPRCGAEFCWQCCGQTNVHEGGKHEPDYKLCPVCGHDVCAP